MYDPLLHLLPEAVDIDEHVIGTYLLETARDVDIVARAEAIALEQSTGTWVSVREETPETREKYAAKVIGIYEIPNYEIMVPPDVSERSFVLRLAFPWVNFGSQIPLMLTTTVGNLACLGRIKLLDLEFPEGYLAGFKGPKFGIGRIRDLLGVHDRPLLNNMIKPNTGFPPEVGAKLAYEAALGGVDIIKDDELLGGSPPFSPLEARVKAYMEAIKRADEKTGEKTLYTVNISDRADKVLDNARRALDAGANALMINYLTTGLSVVRTVAEDPELDVPLLGHGDFGGAVYASPHSGVSSPLIMAKLARLAGVDMLIDIVPYGKVPLLKERYVQIAHTLLSDFHNIRPIFPIVAAGCYPGLVPQVVQDLGLDCMIGVGGAVHGHPMGGVSGAKAFRQAIDAAIQGVPLSEAAKAHEELRVALDAWGEYEPGTQLFKTLRD
jgi:2,3-diketo-5-methylthiopentyl-1-phosphate enolase